MENDKEIKEFLAFIVEEAKSKGKDPNSYIKELGDEGVKEAYKRFKNSKQEKTKKIAQKAEHGIKLLYFKQLNHQCGKDEEVIYYKVGGSVKCGCKKKLETGGRTPKKNSVVDNFKNRKQDLATKDSIAANRYNDQEILNTKPGSYKKNKEGKVQWTPDRTKAPYKKEKGGDLKKDCKGSKMKLIKKGDKVCPKCGKVHSAGIGCTVAKFKMRGGIL